MWLEVLSGEDAGRVVEIPEGRPFVLGRVQGADLVIRDARASRRHAELTATADAVELHDLDSANGTLVDGERVGTATLRDGQRITIGDVRIAVLAREPAATGAPIAEAVRPARPAEGPSWSMVGRLVEDRARRRRRLDVRGRRGRRGGGRGARRPRARRRSAAAGATRSAWPRGRARSRPGRCA